MTNLPVSPEPRDGGGPNQPLVSVRTALVLLLAGLSATGALVLLLFAHRDWAEATLASAGIAALAIKFFHWLIA